MLHLPKRRKRLPVRLPEKVAGKQRPCNPKQNCMEFLFRKKGILTGCGKVRTAEKRRQFGRERIKKEIIII